MSSVDDGWLKPFVPDILGENFFLLFFQSFDPKSSVHRAFIRMLCTPENNQVNENTASNAIAGKYMDFVQHLTRNLANEEQDSPHVKTAWETLAAFLNPELYPETSRLRLTVSFAIMAVSDILEEKDLNYLNTLFFPQINENDLVAASEGRTCIEAMEAFTKYFDRCNETQRNQPALQNQLNKIYLNVEEQRKKESNQLIEASYLGYLNAVKFFINQHNIDINATDAYRLTALMLASKNGNEAVVALLLNEGAKETIDNHDYWGWTALMYASTYSNKAVVALLLNEGAKETIDSRDYWGLTALIHASKCNREAIVALLLNEGAKETINSRDYWGKTALMYACEYNFEDVVVALLLYKDAKETINSCDNHNRTALMHACRYGEEAIVALLLNEGAREKINSFDDKGFTALMYARRDGGHEDVVALLIKAGAIQ